MDSEEGDDVYYDDSEFSDDHDDEVEQLLEFFGNNKVTENNTSSVRQKNYKILKPEEIKQLQENNISDVINMLSVSRSVACTLLSQHRWFPRSLYETRFNSDAAETLAVIDDKVDDLHRSYVDSSPNRKWCPNLSCDLAIEFDESSSGVESYDVTCDCGYKSCWSCGKEGHTPLDCATVAKWVHKNKTEGGEKYAHCYERWASHGELSKEALVEMYTARKEEEEVSSVVEAWEQIVECRRVLKWSYAYGYYLWEGGSERLGLFEHLQKEAESGVETLQACVERRDHLNDQLRAKLVDLTWVTRKHLNNLVRALE